MAKTVSYNVKISGREAVIGSRQVTGAFNNIQGAAQRTSAQLSMFGRTMGGVGGSATSMAMSLAGPLGAAAAVGTLGSVLVNATKRSMAFESALGEVSTLLDDMPGQMEELIAGIREMSSLFGQDVSSMAKATYQIISAGATSTAEAMTVLNASNQLALGGITDVTTAADGLTTILNAYGFSAQQSTAVIDDMFVAMKAGKTQIGELSQSISYVASVAAQTGVSLEEVLAATAALTKGGIPTERSMRGLAQVIASIIKPSSEASKMAERLRFDFSAAALEAKGLHGFLQDLATATQGDAETMAQFFGGVEALVPVLSLTGKQAKDFTKILGDMTGNFGQAEAAAAKMEATTAHQLKIAQTNWENFTLDVGNAITLHILGPIAEAVNGLMRLQSHVPNATDQAVPESSRLAQATSDANWSRISMGMYQPEYRDPTLSTLSRLSLGFYQPNVTTTSGGMRQQPLSGEYTPFSEMEGVVTLEGLANLADELNQDISPKIEQSIHSFYSTIQDAFSTSAQETSEKIAAQTGIKWYEMAQSLRSGVGIGDTGATGYRALDIEQKQIHDTGLNELKDQLAELDAELSATGITIEDLVVPASKKWYEEVSNQKRILSEALGIMGRLNPDLSQFTAALGRAAMGDYIGAASSAIEGLIGHLLDQKDASDAAAQAAASLAHSIREIRGAAGDVSMQYIGKEGFVEFQYALMQPFFERLKQLEADKLSSTFFQEEYGQRAPLAAHAASVQQLLIESVQPDSPLQDMLRKMFPEGGTRQWLQQANLAFGGSEFAGLNMQDIATQMFTVEDAFNSLTDSIVDSGRAAKEVADAQRRLTLSLDEMRIRQQMAADIRTAGKDPLSRYRAYQTAFAQIATLSTSAYSGSSSRTYGPTTGGDTDTGVDVGAKIVPPSDNDIADLSRDIVDTLSDAMDDAFTSRFEPIKIETWDTLFDLSLLSYWPFNMEDILQIIPRTIETWTTFFTSDLPSPHWEIDWATLMEPVQRKLPGWETWFTQDLPFPHWQMDWATLMEPVQRSLPGWETWFANELPSPHWQMDWAMLMEPIQRKLPGWETWFTQDLPSPHWQMDWAMLMEPIQRSLPGWETWFANELPSPHWQMDWATLMEPVQRSLPGWETWFANELPSPHWQIDWTILMGSIQRELPGWETWFANELPSPHWQIDWAMLMEPIQRSLPGWETWYTNSLPSPHWEIDWMALMEPIQRELPGWETWYTNSLPSPHWEIDHRGLMAIIQRPFPKWDTWFQRDLPSPHWEIDWMTLMAPVQRALPGWEVLFDNALPQPEWTVGPGDLFIAPTDSMYRSWLRINVRDVFPLSWQAVKDEIHPDKAKLSVDNLVNVPTQSAWKSHLEASISGLLLAWGFAVKPKINFISKALIPADLVGVPTQDEWSEYMTLPHDRAILAWTAIQSTPWFSPLYLSTDSFMRMPSVDDWKIALNNVAITAGVTWAQDVMPGLNLAPTNISPSSLISLPNGGAWLRYFGIESDLKQDIQLALNAVMKTVTVDLNVNFNAEPLKSNLKDAVIDIMRSNVT